MYTKRPADENATSPTKVEDIATLTAARLSNQFGCDIQPRAIPDFFHTQVTCLFSAALVDDKYTDNITRGKD